MMKTLNNILLVDDDHISNMITERLLSKIRAANDIKIVCNGKEALDYLKKNNKNYPELILLDINMPLMNGFDFLDQWEMNGMIGKSKICMFTTSILNDDKIRSQQYSDVIAYVEKPLTEERAQKIMMLQYDAIFGG